MIKESVFTQSMDAKLWAEAFVKLAKERGPNFATDEGNMIGWFANSIMRGYDEKERQLERDLAAANALCADHERWLREMCDDYRIPADNYAASRRVAINTLIHKYRNEKDAANARIEELERENSKLRSALEIVHFKLEPWQ